MSISQKLRMFIVQEPVIAASCIIGGIEYQTLVSVNVTTMLRGWLGKDHYSRSSCSGFAGASWNIAAIDGSCGVAVITASEPAHHAGLFLPAVVRPMLDSFEAGKEVPPPALSDVVAGVTGKKQ